MKKIISWCTAGICALACVLWMGPFREAFAESYRDDPPKACAGYSVESKKVSQDRKEWTLKEKGGAAVALTGSAEDRYSTYSLYDCIDIDRDGRPEVVVEVFTGGAHCCFGYEFYRKTDGKLQRIGEVYLNNVEGPKFEDLNNDGRPEIVTLDDRLAYFDELGFANSPVLPRIICYHKDEFTDCLTQFPAVIDKELQKLLKRKGGIDEGPNPVALEYLALYLVQGKEAGGWEGVKKHFPGALAWLRKNSADLKWRLLGEKPAETAAKPLSDKETRKFIDQFLKLSEDNKNFDTVMGLYADEVDFYKLGRVAKSAVAQDKKKYFDRWPKREHVIKSLKLSPGGAANEMNVEVVFHYTISDGKKSIEGDADTVLVLSKRNDGILIVSEKEGSSEGGKAGPSEQAKKQLLGEHLFSLQWISWDDFGKAVVTKQNGSLSIKGEQKSKTNDDYVTISGVITNVSAKEFTFTGTIVTKIHHINGGKPCKREGEMMFRITGKRKYWRLVQMDNPCDHATDYVDIYFK